MTPWHEYVGMAFIYLVIAFIALLILWRMFGKFERKCYDKPKPTNTDTLLLRKNCCNCRHSEISTVFPELACPVLGKHVEPHHFCDEWA